MTSENQWQVKKTGWENFNYRKTNGENENKIKKMFNKKTANSYNIKSLFTNTT